jgi:hypothetical protein
MAAKDDLSVLILFDYWTKGLKRAMTSVALQLMANKAGVTWEEAHAQLRRDLGLDNESGTPAAARSKSKAKPKRERKVRAEG